MFTLRWRPFSQQTVINRDDWFLAVRDASVWLSSDLYWRPVISMIYGNRGVVLLFISEKQAQLKYVNVDYTFCSDIERKCVEFCSNMLNGAEKVAERIIRSAKIVSK